MAPVCWPEGGTQVALGPSADRRPYSTLLVSNVRPQGRALLLVWTIRCSPCGLCSGVEHGARQHTGGVSVRAASGAMTLLIRRLMLARSSLQMTSSWQASKRPSSRTRSSMTWSRRSTRARRCCRAADGSWYRCRSGDDAPRRLNHHQRNFCWWRQLAQETLDARRRVGVAADKFLANGHLQLGLGNVNAYVALCGRSQRVSNNP